MIPTTLLSIYLLMLPQMTCVDVVCYKQTPSTVENKINWDVIDLTTWERLETFWIDEDTMQSKITHPDGTTEYTNLTK